MSDNHRYTKVAIALHWSIAALILVNIAVGLVMEGLAPAAKSSAVALHFSCGITVPGGALPLGPAGVSV